MPIIVAPTHGEMQWRVQLRTKKYPAVAASEVFNPKMSALVPEFKATSPGFDPRSYIYELICSEAFLVTSPANLLGMVDAVRRLRINFGESTPPNVEEMKAQLLQDISTFAQYTSLSFHDNLIC